MRLHVFSLDGKASKSCDSRIVFESMARRMQPSGNLCIFYFFVEIRLSKFGQWLKKQEEKENGCTRFGSDILSDNSSCARKQEEAAFSPDLFISHHFLVHRIIIRYDKTDLSSVLWEGGNQRKTDTNLSTV